MGKGKTLQLFLMDGTVAGRIKGTVMNWTGIVFKIPREDLNKCKNRTDLNQDGVYFLYGSNGNKETVYIGQAGSRKNGKGILNRLMEHAKSADKDFWTEAVVFTTSDNTFGPTEISWLENKFCNLAINAAQCEVKNGSDPSPGNITEEKESVLEEWAELALLVVGTLGYRVFEPARRVIKIEDKPAEKPDNIFYLQRHIKKFNRTARAQMRYDGENNFVVLKGSEIITEDTPNQISSNLKKLRHSDKVSGNGILKEDVTFTSASTAAQFVLGKTSNGLVDWKNKNGICFKDIVQSGNAQ